MIRFRCDHFGFPLNDFHTKRNPKKKYIYCIPEWRCAMCRILCRSRLLAVDSDWNWSDRRASFSREISPQTPLN